MRDVQRPKAPAPRVRFLDEPELVRLADAHEEPFCTLSALLAGMGIEVSVALGPRDVDRTNREIRAAGTETHSRDRVVPVGNADLGGLPMSSRCSLYGQQACIRREARHLARHAAPLLGE